MPSSEGYISGGSVGTDQMVVPSCNVGDGLDRSVKVIRIRGLGVEVSVTLSSLIWSLKCQGKGLGSLRFLMEMLYSCELYSDVG